MEHEEVEEEDFGVAMQNLEIPYKELEQHSIDLGYDLRDGLKEFIEESNLQLDDPREFEDPTSTNSPKVRSNAPKRPRNKRGRRKRRCFKSATCLFDSESEDKSCLHCGTSNTPLWREGPKGARTLCNACGMRYRTGRLLPEYRPASSPGFKPNVHSNFHRKVMEIRRERNSPPNRF